MDRLWHSFVIALVIGSTVSARLAWAQSICRPADANSAGLIEYLGRYSSATSGDNAESRVDLGLPVLPTNQLVLVTQESICRKARTTYQTVVAAQGGTGLSGRVYVVKVGGVYAVLDPDYHWGPAAGYWKVVILDSKFKKLSAFTTDT